MGLPSRYTPDRGKLGKKQGRRSFEKPGRGLEEAYVKFKHAAEAIDVYKLRFFQNMRP